MESLFAGVEDRRQETGEMGRERGGRSKNCQSDFSAACFGENPHFFNQSNRKAHTFLRHKKPKTNISQWFDIESASHN
ncbi:MAG: hypothetical protein F6K18_04665 [Okeania sp. SIO2C2]|uniref:hypothetical protein n=1 Tax=Okeania sp. SIO2C2 TaxID=2607787 RepID=UPI0013BE3197|nr:hypothetical protein [Okeania sp. SIO2C2]NEP86167.1 hypothetical protein [Okeania sp. SIO2C2]